jgi:hypothetical protein
MRGDKMNDQEREMLALECVVAVLSGLITMWLGSGAGLSVPSAVAAIVISLGCLGLVDGSNAMELGARRAVLAGSVAVYWLIVLLAGYLGWQGSLFAYLNPRVLVLYVLFFLWALCVSLASRPIVAFVIRLFNGGDAPITRLNKILKALAVTIGAIGAVWAAVTKLMP